MSEIKLGTCGYGYYNAPEEWKETYESKLQAFTHEFDLLEVQKTFYKLPRVQTCEKWRNRAKGDFVFTLKAWQALTHTLRSPTWRGNDEQLSEKQREDFGYLRPNKHVVKAWEDTLERARALSAPVVVIQCPGSFEPTEENERNMRELLGGIPRNGVKLAWEPRGDWLNEPERVAGLCEDLHLIHTVDLLRERPFYVGSAAYVRMHGLNEERYDYNYDYSREELGELADRLRKLGKNCETVYCLFNNFEKFKNVRTLESMI